MTTVIIIVSLDTDALCALKILTVRFERKEGKLNLIFFLYFFRAF